MKICRSIPIFALVLCAFGCGVREHAPKAKPAPDGAGAIGSDDAGSESPPKVDALSGQLADATPQPPDATPSRPMPSSCLPIAPFRNSTLLRRSMASPCPPTVLRRSSTLPTRPMPSRCPPTVLRRSSTLPPVITLPISRHSPMGADRLSSRQDRPVVPGATAAVSSVSTVSAAKMAARGCVGPA